MDSRHMEALFLDILQLGVRESTQYDNDKQKHVEQTVRVGTRNYAVMRAGNSTFQICVLV